MGVLDDGPAGGVDFGTVRGTGRPGQSNGAGGAIGTASARAAGRAGHAVPGESRESVAAQAAGTPGTTGTGTATNAADTAGAAGATRTGHDSAAGMEDADKGQLTAHDIEAATGGRATCASGTTGAAEATGSAVSTGRSTTPVAADAADPARTPLTAIGAAEAETDTPLTAVAAGPAETALAAYAPLGRRVVHGIQRQSQDTTGDGDAPAQARSTSPPTRDSTGHPADPRDAGCTGVAAGAPRAAGARDAQAGIASRATSAAEAWAAGVAATAALSEPKGHVAVTPRPSLDGVLLDG